jgi:hypothetical protein
MFTTGVIAMAKSKHLIDENCPDYEALKEMALSLGRPVYTLIVQDAGADPFYAELPMRELRAHWFKEIWDRLDIQPGAHLRRVHYKLVSQSPLIRLPREVNGTLEYINTFICWQFLGDAASDARYLGLIPCNHIVDQRNAGTEVRYDGDETPARIGVGQDPNGLDGMEMSLAVRVPEFPILPRLVVLSPTIPQPYCVELWIEKSTMDDVLRPLAERYNVNYTSGTGDISITRCHDLIERACSHGKPVRVLTITDFDPGGSNMPIALARKLEYLIRNDVLDLDVQVRPVVLTKEQVRRYRLPRTPIKDTNKGRAAFELRHGAAGATELDALEALRPGELRKIVEKEIRRYVDTDLEDNVRETKQEVQSDLNDITEAAHAERAEEIEQLQGEYAELAEEIEEASDRFREEFEGRYRGRIDDLTGRIKALIQGLTDTLDGEKPDPDEIEWPEPEPGDEDDDPLFNPLRAYVEQMDRYKEHQRKPLERRPRSDKGTKRSNGGEQ